LTPGLDAVRVDARGLRCPLPVLKLARAMRLAPDAATFELVSDDPGTVGELASWSASTGHAVIATGQGFVVTRA
jgi:tRNA 2-thiouridine synthesizing protein A